MACEMQLTGLDEFLFKPGRRERMEVRRVMKPALGPDGNPIPGRVELGEPLPSEEQFTFGAVLLNLLMTMKTPETLGKVLLVGKLVDRVSEAMATGGAYPANDTALALMRQAVQDNGMGYRPYVLAQLLEKVGTGEADLRDDV